MTLYSGNKIIKNGNTFEIMKIISKYVISKVKYNQKENETEFRFEMVATHSRDFSHELVVTYVK